MFESSSIVKTRKDIYYKKNTIILCSASWIHYWTDFDDFGLQMTVGEWSSALPRKNWGFQNASLQKCLLRFKGGADYLLGIHLQIMKRWADYLEQDGFVYIICLLAANDMFGLCVSKKGEGGGGAEGAVLACNPLSPPPLPRGEHSSKTDKHQKMKRFALIMRAILKTGLDGSRSFCVLYWKAVG